MIKQAPMWLLNHVLIKWHHYKAFYSVGFHGYLNFIKKNKIKKTQPASAPKLLKKCIKSSLLLFTRLTFNGFDGGMSFKDRNNHAIMLQWLIINWQPWFSNRYKDVKGLVRLSSMNSLNPTPAAACPDSLTNRTMFILISEHKLIHFQIHVLKDSIGTGSGPVLYSVLFDTHVDLRGRYLYRYYST